MLRPGGYFILSTKHNSIEAEEGMLTLFEFCEIPTTFALYFIAFANFLCAYYITS